MDAPFLSRDPAELPRPRGPLAAWVPFIVIVAILALAGLAAASVTDTRDFAARHATVVKPFAVRIEP